MKKIICMSLVIVILAASLMSCETLSDNFTGEKVIYKTSSDGTYAIVTGYEGNETDVKIAEKYNDLPVKEIGSRAFEKCDSLTSINIPDSVTSIGDEAFANCTKLTSISIPGSLTSVGYDAFEGCPETIFNEYDGGKYLGNFENPYLVFIAPIDENVRAITLHEKTKMIVGGAFYGCDNLTNISIPNGVTSIGYNVFFGCTSLKSISIPKDVTIIENSAFEGCSSLTSIGIPDGIMSIGYDAFRACSSLTNINIPKSVTRIETWAFRDCTSLTSISIPESVVSIGDEVFRDCISLTSISIPDSVTSIGNSVFEGCPEIIFNRDNGGKYLGNSQNPYLVFIAPVDENVSAITLHEKTKVIGNGAFKGRRVGTGGIGELSYFGSLASISIPEGVTSIGDDVFRYCTSLTGINMPDSVTSIGERAFYGCSSLASIRIPKDVTSIGYWAFKDCDGLTSIQYNGTMAQWKTIENKNLGKTLTIYCTDGSLKCE